MKFSILSDLHLDQWISNNRSPNLKWLKQIFDGYLDPSPDIEVLIVAGDISEYIYHFQILEELASIYNYKKVFAVLGNHDIYLTKPLHYKLYGTSRIKQKAWYDVRSDVVTLFNGTSEIYKGVKFGGAMGWYDATYNRPQGYVRETLNREWKRTMADSYYLPDYNHFLEIFDQEIPKVEAVLDCDVIITHICPLSARMAVQPKFRDDKSSMFYTFDGAQYLDKTTAKYWVYGHSHGQHRFEVYNTTCIMNTLGYPSEKHLPGGPMTQEIIL